MMSKKKFITFLNGRKMIEICDFLARNGDVRATELKFKVTNLNLLLNYEAFDSD